MKYRDLVQIPEPLEKVKAVRNADTVDSARRDVATFVVSDRMAKQLTDVVIPNLRLDGAGDTQGLLVVGTYGTGKTHLLSVIGGIAEFPELVADLTHPDVRAAAGEVAGQFLVVRFDIGATAMSMRDIVCRELEKGVAKQGVSFTFPSLQEATNTKDSIDELMAAVDLVHPGKGLLFVLDEMLDYLRGRKDAELIHDLAFLREVGEAAKSTRFRFIGGVQESLFDNPRFGGVADAVKRVRDRFEQVRIAREDVAYVVRQRLLRKDDAQKAKIRDHLQPFTPMFEGMAEKLDEFVELYPVHPAYLLTFEQLTLVEKREILRTIEKEITRLQDVDVPEKEPGLLCIDSYRARLAEDPSFRTVPEVQEVLDKSDVVRTKLPTAMADKQYVDSAIRIVDALTVHRLTTDDIRARIGLTVEELRDQLCLVPPGMPKNDAKFLRVTVETIINKTLAAVSGQFISRNEDNGQVFLDVAKDVDYDQLIQQRADTLDADRLDAAYYTAMEELMGVRDDPYVAGYRIWAYDLPWTDRNVDRTGYLFMGAPNERSTAQPPRDFYLYFLQPYDMPKFVDEEKADEVFIRLAKPDDTFTAALRRYAGARELAKESTSDRRPIYTSKADEALRAMVQWLKANMGEAVTVTYAGQQDKLITWLGKTGGERTQVRDQINSVAAALLFAHFEARYPGYPRLGQEITRGNLGDAVRTCLIHLTDPKKATTASRKILQSLGLLDSAGAVTADGTFASWLTDRLAAAGGKVVNRSELLIERPDEGRVGGQPLLTWGPWHLEPAWMVVTAAALVHLGKAELVYADGKVDALGLGRLPGKGLDDLTTFLHLAPPAAPPTAGLRAVAELLEILPAAVPDTGATEPLVTEFATRANNLLTKLVNADATLDSGIELWGHNLIELVEERRARIAALRFVADDVRARNSVGKLNKVSLSDDQVDAAKAGRRELDWLERLQSAQNRLASVANYLREAVSYFGDEFQLSQDARRLRKEMIDALSADPIDATAVSELANRGDTTAAAFAKAAAAYYRHAFLDVAGDQRKQKLQESATWKALGKLSAISVLPGGGLAELQHKLVEIRTKSAVDENTLRSSLKLGTDVPGAITGPSAQARLEEIEDRVAAVYAKWVASLRETLAEDDLADQIALLAPNQRTLVESFLSDRHLPDPVTDEFVDAVNQVLRRFEIRHVSRSGLAEALFPGGAAADRDALKVRLDSYLTALAAGAGDNVRYVADQDPT